MSSIDTDRDRPEGREPLPPALQASPGVFASQESGLIHFYSDLSGQGRPLVLVHSINAAPSAFEMKPLFEHYRGRRPVFALDLPGFGQSELADRRYTPAFFATAIAEFLGGVVREPADVVVLSLSAEFSARAALAWPDRFQSLVMFSPTGFGDRSPPSANTSERMLKVLDAPGLGQALFRGLTARMSIRYFLGRSLNGDTPPELVDHAHATSRQPGARHAPLHFLAGALFTRDARADLYDATQRPVLVLYDEDPNVGFEHLDAFVAGHANWRAERLAGTRGMPQWDCTEDTIAAMERFWDAPPGD